MNSSVKKGDADTAVATLAGGCFWCLDSAFRRLRGVHRVVSGYTGGHQAHPDYHSVCTGETGHAEVVQVHYDASLLDYRSLLTLFFALHDPTTLNRQGADVGSQYRSAIFYHDLGQQQTAQAVIAELEQQSVWPDPVVTQVVPATIFYPAEDHHQDYYARNPGNRYCQWVIEPKLTRLAARFPEWLKDEDRV